MWSCSTWNHFQHKSRVAGGCFTGCLTLLQHQIPSFKVQWGHEKVLFGSSLPIRLISSFSSTSKILLTPIGSWERVLLHLLGEVIVISSLCMISCLPAETQGYSKTQCLSTSCSCKAGENHMVWLGRHLLIVLLPKVCWIHLQSFH